MVRLQSSLCWCTFKTIVVGVLGVFTILQSTFGTVEGKQSFGVIRWDCWNGLQKDVISETVALTMRPEKFHWRLPWYVTVEKGSGNLAFNADKQSIMDSEIKYAFHAGISFFAYDTYCVWPQDKDIDQCNGYWGKTKSGLGPSSRGYKAEDPAYGLRLHMKSSLKNLVNISMVLLGASPALPVMRRRYLPIINDPSFHRVLVNGEWRPILFLFQAGEEEAKMNGGWAAWREQWESFRNESIAQGSGNPYFVAMCVGVGNYQQAVALKDRLGFDAISSYALPGGTVDGMPFSKQHASALEFWNTAKKNQDTLVPNIPTGWDPRPRAEHPPIWVNESAQHYIEPKPEELTNLVADASSFIRNNPSLVPTKTAIVYAWNENTEGGWLLPTKGEGKSRLDAFKRGVEKHSET